MHDLAQVRTLRLLLLITAVMSFGTNVVSAQARKAATRSAEFDTFGMFSGVDNNYRPPLANYGGTLGADYTQFLPRYHGLIIPSFQLRGTFARGSQVTEKTIQGGFRLASTYRNFHPYGDLLVGEGIITFAHPGVMTNGMPYARDSSFIYVYGGGVTYDVNSRFSAMVDYQYQYWNLGQQPPVRFYPRAYSIGVLWHLPLKAYKTR